AEPCPELSYYSQTSHWQRIRAGGCRRAVAAPGEHGEINAAADRGKCIPACVPERHRATSYDPGRCASGAGTPPGYGGGQRRGHVREAACADAAEAAGEPAGGRGRVAAAEKARRH